MNKEEIQNLKSIKYQIAKTSDILWGLRMELNDMIIDDKELKKSRQKKSKSKQGSKK